MEESPDLLSGENGKVNHPLQKIFAGSATPHFFQFCQIFGLQKNCSHISTPVGQIKKIDNRKDVLRTCLFIDLLRLNFPVNKYLVLMEPPQLF